MKLFWRHFITLLLVKMFDRLCSFFRFRCQNSDRRNEWRTNSLPKKCPSLILQLQTLRWRPFVFRVIRSWRLLLTCSSRACSSDLTRVNKPWFSDSVLNSSQCVLLVRERCVAVLCWQVESGLQGDEDTQCPSVSEGQLLPASQSFSDDSEICEEIIQGENTSNIYIYKYILK